MFPMCLGDGEGTPAAHPLRDRRMRRARATIGSSSRVVSRYLPEFANVEQIPERVAEKVDAQYRGHDEQAGIDAQPPGDRDETPIFT